MIEVLEEALGRKANRILMPPQPGDVAITSADGSDLERDTGFRPARRRSRKASRVSWSGTADSTARSWRSRSFPARGDAGVLVGQQADRPDDQRTEEPQHRGFRQVVNRDVVGELRERRYGHRRA